MLRGFCLVLELKALPLPEVVSVLENYETYLQVYKNLPDIELI
jgi:hypothetical protein